MEDVVLVHILNSGESLDEELEGLKLREDFVVGLEVEEVAFRSVVHQEVNAFG